MTVTVRSFAKINLGLRIGPARDDGFHELLTVYQTIGLHDVIRVNVTRGSGIAILCADLRVPRDESNTCFRIVEKAMNALCAKGRVFIEIEKRLPVQGGLGGASANAVATLLALEKALKKTLPAEEKFRIAAEVGSDLPLFLVGGTTLGVGRGEQVYPLPDFPAVSCVVVTPEIGVSTPKAFAEWDRRTQGLKSQPSPGLDTALKGRSSTAATIADAVLKRSSATAVSRASTNSSSNPAEPCSTWTGEGACPHTGRESADSRDDRKLTSSTPSDRMKMLGYSLSAWLSEMYSGAPSRRGRAENPLLALDRAGIENDFEQVVFPEYPELGEAKRALIRAGARYASLSGSGSTLYGLFASRHAAAAAVDKLRRAGWAAQATETLTRTAYWRRFFKA
ncbi:MAG TPA: 4-(cytidine 5'-diphospho)-2-C-methyl-D-erythritol kinase [Candidatus Sulfotelmatobacter sp.]|nr:4-(cytidine 5'-diphospho)-2-C-methyl-D-erythritol kinase [Candidatus Sulfotelmatobacter sp.]